MDARYHIEITQRALTGRFDEASLQTIIRANLGQDKLANLIGHPEIHFDDSAFAAGERYIVEQRRQAALAMTERDDRLAALAAFGRLLHGRQDFYAHSNWVQLWTGEQGGISHCSPEQTEICVDPLAVPQLISGDGSPWHFVAARLPLLGGVVRRRWIPQTSHEHMHLDNPGRGPLFPFAFSAAIKHTCFELETLLGVLAEAGGETLAEHFLGQSVSTNE